MDQKCHLRGAQKTKILKSMFIFALGQLPLLSLGADPTLDGGSAFDREDVEQNLRKMEKALEIWDASFNAASSVVLTKEDQREKVVQALKDLDRLGELDRLVSVASNAEPAVPVELLVNPVGTFGAGGLPIPPAPPSPALPAPQTPKSPHRLTLAERQKKKDKEAVDNFLGTNGISFTINGELFEDVKTFEGFQPMVNYATQVKNAKDKFFIEYNKFFDSIEKFFGNLSEKLREQSQYVVNEKSDVDKILSIYDANIDLRAKIANAVNVFLKGIKLKTHTRQIMGFEECLKHIGEQKKTLDEYLAHVKFWPRELSGAYAKELLRTKSIGEKYGDSYYREAAVLGHSSVVEDYSENGMAGEVESELENKNFKNKDEGFDWLTRLYTEHQGPAVLVGGLRFLQKLPEVNWSSKEDVEKAFEAWRQTPEFNSHTLHEVTKNISTYDHRYKEDFIPFMIESLKQIRNDMLNSYCCPYFSKLLLYKKYHDLESGKDAIFKEIVEKVSDSRTDEFKGVEFSCEKDLLVLLTLIKDGQASIKHVVEGLINSLDPRKPKGIFLGVIGINFIKKKEYRKHGDVGDFLRLVYEYCKYKEIPILQDVPLYGDAVPLKILETGKISQKDYKGIFDDFLKQVGTVMPVSLDYSVIFPERTESLGDTMAKFFMEKRAEMALEQQKREAAQKAEQKVNKISTSLPSASNEVLTPDKTEDLLQTLNNQIFALQTEKGNLEQQLNDLRAQLLEKDKIIKQLQDKLESKNNSLAQNRDSRNQVMHANNNAAPLLARNDGALEKANARVEQLEKEKEQWNAKAKEFKKELEAASNRMGGSGGTTVIRSDNEAEQALRDELERVNARLELKDRDLNSKDEEIQRLNLLIAELQQQLKESKEKSKGNGKGSLDVFGTERDDLAVQRQQWESVRQELIEKMEALQRKQTEQEKRAKNLEKREKAVKAKEDRLVTVSKVDDSGNVSENILLNMIQFGEGRSVPANGLELPASPSKNAVVPMLINPVKIPMALPVNAKEIKGSASLNARPATQEQEINAYEDSSDPVQVPKVNRKASSDRMRVIRRENHNGSLMMQAPRAEPIRVNSL